MAEKTYVGFLRGINVGRAKRVAMAELRDLAVRLGYTKVRTVLNSGNLVFASRGDTPQAAASRIEKALASELGVTARVTVRTDREIAVVVSENPLAKIADDPSRLLVAFPAEPDDLAVIEELQNREWHPEAVAVGSHAAYIWCPDGVIASQALAAVTRALGGAVTSRNWNTVVRLHALAGGR